ncbi:unnamed protein product [Cuscuta epithymum]|uniref:Uncharacterized protein n=1 Tax=Cuscuta epithymum TaxID=186058 RepID=A0AAV0CX00_9ASTE|nr:unnamed protein product [Cuscuta epithymum]CAH9142265.1 unnamed protein product [Cuscuta epithymum]
MLVPPMVNGLEKPTKNQQEWRQRAQLVNPLLPLKAHPPLQLPPVIPGPPSLEIHYHHPCIEITRANRPEYPRKHRVGPESVGEVFGEIRVAVFRSSDDP